jgi:hypothetical protein
VSTRPVPAAPIVVTRVAHAGHDDHRFMGHGALTELLGHESITGLFALAVLGRRVDADAKTTLDMLAAATSAADPRIWPLKASRIAASYGEALAGYAAGQLAMMGPYMSPRIVGAAAEELTRLRKNLDAAGSDPAAVDRAVQEHMTNGGIAGRLAGYGVPVRDKDERFAAFRAEMVRIGRDALPYWSAQETLTVAMRSDKQIEPNIGIGLAAGLLDIGCNPSQARALATHLLGHTFAANAFEAGEQRSAAMQKLPVGAVHYVGQAPRKSPRSA